MFVKEFSKQRQEEARLRNELIRGCSEFLSGHGPSSPADEFREIAEYCEKHGIESDAYGIGRFLNSFEEEMAELLGKEAAVFMPSGVMAQGIALRIASERAKIARVAFHPTCHIEVNEHRSYAELHGLRATLLGERNTPITAQDVLSLAEPVSALVIELPYRRLGGVMPSWDELEALKAAAHKKGIHLHLDGARLWEAQPFYRRSFSEICRGFDSVYVSYYKGIGALTGSMLFGRADFIAEARIWQRRQGGNLFQLTPYWVSAKMRFDQHRESFGRYYERTLSLAEALSAVEGIELKPKRPHSPMMHLLIRGTPAELSAARDRIAREDRLWLGGLFLPTDSPERSLLEVSVGEATLRLKDQSIIDALRKLLAIR
jgi:threonine aldolase